MMEARHRFGLRPREPDEPSSHVVALHVESVPQAPAYQRHFCNHLIVNGIVWLTNCILDGTSRPSLPVDGRKNST